MRFEYIIKIVIISIAYFLSAKVVSPLSLGESGSVFAIWPPTGVALSSLFLFGFRIWPGIFIGALVLNMTLTPFAPSFQIAITNTLGPLFGFWLLSSFANINIFDSVKNMAFFFLFIIISSIVTATGGLFALIMHGVIPSDAANNVWIGWFLGDLIGFLLITPIVASLRSEKSFSRNLFTLEGLSMFILLTLTTLVVFGPIAPFDLIVYPIVYFLLPPLIWATLRFNLVVAVTSLLVIAVASIYGTILGFGPFIRDISNQSLLLLQSFNGMLAVTILFMAAVFRTKELTAQELIDSQKTVLQQSRLTAMADMMSMLAHQWRQPISSITMKINSLLFDIELKEINEKELKKSVLSINEQIKELSKMIDDFGDFFSPDESLKLVNLNKVIDDAIEIIDKSFENRDIEFKVLPHSDFKDIETYPRMLMQVMVNMFINSSEVFIDRKVTNGKIVVDIQQSSDMTTITICDNAGGVKLEEPNEIFEPYFTTKNQYNKAGLGLYMSKMIVEKHFGGKLSVENKEDGACFTIRI